MELDLGPVSLSCCISFWRVEHSMQAGISMSKHLESAKTMEVFDVIIAHRFPSEHARCKSGHEKLRSRNTMAKLQCRLEL